MMEIHLRYPYAQSPRSYFQTIIPERNELSSNVVHELQSDPSVSLILRSWCLSNRTSKPHPYRLSVDSRLSDDRYHA